MKKSTRILMRSGTHTGAAIYAAAAAAAVAASQSPQEGERVVGAHPALAAPYGGPPDRICVDPESEFYDKAALDRGIEIKFKGTHRKTDVVEYCVSGGWARVQLKDRFGKVLWRGGKHVAFKMQGPVKVWWRDQPEPDE